MLSGTQIFSTSASLTASSAGRRAGHEARRRELISTLRKLAALASLEHYDEPSRAQRARWSELVTKVDDQLLRLCAEEGRAA
jgi:hypothetical protein